MISTDNKLFDEVDIPESSRIVSENNGNGTVERESSWTGQISGLDSFPSGTAKGHGNSIIFKNGISISNWQGIFTTDKGQKISFVGKDASKNGKFYVLRTWFTDDRGLEWINGLVCLLDGRHELQSNSFVCSGYKLM
jgi:hypothetical protein